MIRLVIRRVGTSLAALFGATVFTFIALRVMPGDPARLFLGPFATQDAVDAMNVELGLTKPLPEQYVSFVRDFLTGDWGRSYSTGEQVVTLLADRFPATIELGLYAFLFAFVGAIALAILAAYRRGLVSDGGSRMFANVALGVPQFWLGLILLIVFFESLGIAPGPDGRLSPSTVPPPSVTGLFTIDALIAGQFTTFADALGHLILPAIALGLFPLGFLLRLLRANLLDVEGEPFVMVARSRGLPRFRVFIRQRSAQCVHPDIDGRGADPRAASCRQYPGREGVQLARRRRPGRNRRPAAGLFCRADLCPFERRDLPDRNSHRRLDRGPYRPARDVRGRLAMNGAKDPSLLSIDDLSVGFQSPSGRILAADRVTLSVGRGSRMALVGESGSGKSTLALAVLGLLPSTARIISGSISFEGHQLDWANDRAMSRLRGRGIGFVYQDPMVRWALDPIRTIGDHLVEAIRANAPAHGHRSRVRRAAARPISSTKSKFLPPQTASTITRNNTPGACFSG